MRMGGAMNPCSFAVCVMLVWTLRAQDTPGGVTQPPAKAVASGSQRPRIGLVVEGGGALDLENVGVIKWMEENRIPVDVVDGTRMGGLVGGIYASGESPDQLSALIRSINWSEVLTGVTPYRDLSFRRKEDRREYQNAFEFGLKKGTQFPSGFNSGQQVGLILDRVGLPYSEMKSFDQLPIPFRCVATDLVAGDSYVFDHGSLAEAMRASMSLPAFFTPVRERNRVLVDGGLVNNLPVDVARQIGADILIAVHFALPRLGPKAPAPKATYLSVFSTNWPTWRVIRAIVINWTK